MVMDDREDCVDKFIEDQEMCTEDDINYDSSKLLNVRNYYEECRISKVIPVAVSVCCRCSSPS